MVETNTYTLIAALLLVSATDVAVRATVAGTGAVPGAVYVTAVGVAALSTPHELPEQPFPDKPQVTPLA